MCQMDISNSNNEVQEIGPELLAEYLRGCSLIQQQAHAQQQKRLPEHNAFPTPIVVSAAGCDGGKNCLIIDCRSFVEYNRCRVKGAINAFYSKIMRRRLLDQKTCSSELILNHLSHGLGNFNEKEVEDVDLIIYAATTPASEGGLLEPKESNEGGDGGVEEHVNANADDRIAEVNAGAIKPAAIGTGHGCLASVAASTEKFIRFLSYKLKQSNKLNFRRIMLLKGG